MKGGKPGTGTARARGGPPRGGADPRKAEAMTVPEDDRIIGVREAAEILDTSDQMVRKLARKGRIPAYRLPGGRAFKFFRRELLEHKRKNTTPIEEGDEVIDSRAVAELLRVDVQLVRKYAREKRIPAYRHTGRRGYEFSRNEVLEHVRSGRMEAGGGEDGEAEAGEG